MGSTCLSHRALSDRYGIFGIQRGRADRSDPFIGGQRPGVRCTTCGNSNLLPDSATDVGAVVARVSGFATVSLQMRGTGCSGGAFDLLGYPSDYDAYDAIEIISTSPGWPTARSAWSASVTPVCHSSRQRERSSGLAAVAPMSPTDDLFSTGYPGGIYNNGFAADWTGARIDDAKAAASYSGGKIVQSATTPISNTGQPWTYDEIDSELESSNGGASACLSNQALHNQSEDLDQLVGAQLVTPGAGQGRDPALFDERSMVGWAAHVNVPVFLSGALQDEKLAAVGTASNPRRSYDHASLHQHGQRWTHRLGRSPDAQPLARIPRHLCRGQGADPTRWVGYPRAR